MGLDPCQYFLRGEDAGRRLVSERDHGGLGAFAWDVEEAHICGERFEQRQGPIKRVQMLEAGDHLKCHPGMEDAYRQQRGGPSPI
jgi:hypothetical protein